MDDDCFDFSLWAEHCAFSTDSVEKLKKANVVTRRSIAGLLEDELLELKLALGDRSTFRSEWQIFREQDPTVKPKHKAVPEVDGTASAPDATEPSGNLPGSSSVGAYSLGPAGLAGGPQTKNPPGPESHRVTTADLAKDRELQQLVDTVCSPVLKDFLAVQDGSGASPGEVFVNFPYLAIPDFVKGLSEVEEEVLQTGASGSQVVLKGTRKKPLAKDVSISQWIGANQRIYNKLLPMFKQNDIREYGLYVEQISELLGKYPASNVFTVDDLHRKEVAEKGVSWAYVNVFDHIHNLRDATKPAAKQTAQQGQGGQNSRQGANRFTNKDNMGNPICVDYNMASGCRFKEGLCRFKHVCSIPGCFKDHPSTKHEGGGP